MTRDDVTDVQTTLLNRSFYTFQRVRFRHRRFGGDWSGEVGRDVLRVGRVALVVLYDPVRDCVGMIEQLRIGAYLAGYENPWMLEFVAGLVEADEDPIDTARREVHEESGFAVKDIVPLRRWLASPGGTDEDVHLFVACVDADRTGTVHGLAHEEENIRLVVMPTAEAIAAVDGDRVLNAHSIIGLREFARRHEALRARWTATADAG